MANSEQDQVLVLVRDHDRLVHLPNVGIWDALTMLAAVSSDPRSFHELDLAWQRYRSDQPLEQLAWEAAEAERRHGPWLLVDLACQRTVSNDPELIPTEPAAFQRDEGPSSPTNPVVWCNTPPWWQTSVEARWEAALSPVPYFHEPRDFRGILYGRPLIDGLAQRMWAVVDSESVPGSLLHEDDVSWNKPLDEKQRKTMARWHELTVRVHADWLMTPRDDLGAQPPRSFLHRGREWVDRETENRQKEWSRTCQPPRALDRNTYSYRHGPMGTAEVVMYFDLCRAVICAGGRFLSDPAAERSQLSVTLDEAKRTWLAEGTIDGDPTPPTEIIENSRRHMPQVAREDAHIDCSCPICRMMAEQSDVFGPAFSMFDGHHLELDDEFAFSLCETLEEWKDQQAEFQQITGEPAP